MNNTEAEKIIRAGGRVQRVNGGFEYFMKGGMLYFNDCDRDSRSGGFEHNFRGDFKIIQI